MNSRARHPFEAELYYLYKTKLTNIAVIEEGLGKLTEELGKPCLDCGKEADKEAG
jgi:hypothetical protein